MTVVSRSILQALTTTGHPPDKIKVIPMGVDSERFSPASRVNIKPSDHPELLFVGRLSEKKGVTYLLQAMPKIISELPDVKLRLVGGGELSEKLQRQARELNIEDHIDFCGAVPNNQLPAYYAAAKIFIGPSIQASDGDTEGFGLTFVEASLSGCLVIGTKVGGIGDIIKDGETGFLVPQKNSTAIAEKVIYALNKKNADRKARNKGYL